MVQFDGFDDNLALDDLGLLGCIDEVFLFLPASLIFEEGRVGGGLKGLQSLEHFRIYWHFASRCPILEFLIFFNDFAQ